MITMGRSLTIQESQRVICFLHGKSLWLLQILLHPEAMRTMSPLGIQWASQTGIWMDPWMCRFLSPRIQIHKSVMDAMNEINRALGKRHFSWAIRNSMEFLRPWNTMDKVRKICICIDLWMHLVIFSKKAIRHPKTACYNMWVTTKFGQIPL